ncbi:MAG TPA: metalloregulator ArsR/SmtB family transcription factor [Acidimicrobiales bacterium]|nr:metalloregulator ArsR/SmtB family transcription factor [Acidimicrobiales bacterium]
MPGRTSRQEEADGVGQVIAALASPIRREILSLVWSRELRAGDIAAAFAVTKPTISQHLAVLRDAGLVRMTAAGTSRRYRARPDALSGLRAALQSSFKWTPADEVPERELSAARTVPMVVVSAEVDTDRPTTFRALTDARIYSRWLGAPVTISEEGRFAATMEWGTEVRGRYELVCPPELIVMRWDFDDDNVPVPGQELTGYLRLGALPGDRTHVEVHQLVNDLHQAEFMEGAWSMVLGRLTAGVVAAFRDDTPAVRRPRRAKRRRTA